MHQNPLIRISDNDKTGSLARDEDAKMVECGFKIAVHNEYLFHPTCNLDFATGLCVLIKLTTN